MFASELFVGRNGKHCGGFGWLKLHALKPDLRSLDSDQTPAERQREREGDTEWERRSVISSILKPHTSLIGLEKEK